MGNLNKFEVLACGQPRLLLCYFTTIYTAIAYCNYVLYYFLRFYILKRSTKQLRRQHVTVHR
jgi:hypothetical protein